MARKIAEKVPGWVARILLPEIRSIVKEEVASEVKRVEDTLGTEIKRVEGILTSEIKRIDEKFTAELAGMRSDIKRVEEKFTAKMDGIKVDFKRVEDTLTSEIRRVEGTLGGKVESFEKSLDLVRYVAVLEAKVRELEAKLPKEQA